MPEACSWILVTQFYYKLNSQSCTVSWYFFGPVCCFHCLMDFPEGESGRICGQRSNVFLLRKGKGRKGSLAEDLLANIFTLVLPYLQWDQRPKTVRCIYLLHIVWTSVVAKGNAARGGTFSTAIYIMWYQKLCVSSTQSLDQEEMDSGRVSCFNYVTHSIYISSQSKVFPNILV